MIKFFDDLRYIFVDLLLLNVIYISTLIFVVCGVMHIAVFLTTYSFFNFNIAFFVMDIDCISPKKDLFEKYNLLSTGNCTFIKNEIYSPFFRFLLYEDLFIINSFVVAPASVFGLIVNMYYDHQFMINGRYDMLESNKGASVMVNAKHVLQIMIITLGISILIQYVAQQYFQWTVPWYATTSVLTLFMYAAESSVSTQERFRFIQWKRYVDQTLNRGE